MPNTAQALETIASELDVLGDLVVEQDAKIGEVLSLVQEMHKMLGQALDVQREIPELRRRIVDVEDQLNAAQ